MVKFLNLLLILVNVGLAVSGQMLIKIGMQRVGVIDSSNVLQLLSRAFLNLHVILGLTAYIVAAGTWIIVLSRVDLSFAYPMLSLGYILVLILSIYLLKEQVTPERAVGTLLIIIGVVFIYRS